MLCIYDSCVFIIFWLSLFKVVFDTSHHANGLCIRKQYDMIYVYLWLGCCCYW